MPKYPNIEDDEFYKKISTIFKKFKIRNKTLTMQDICYPKKYKLQLPQQFGSNFINPKTPYKGLLVYHQIGAGKTCFAISIAEQWKHKRNILVVVPASLVGNFYDELMTKCTGDEYLKPKDRKTFTGLLSETDKYKEMVKKFNKRINKYYTIISYNKFVDKLNRKTINLKNTLLIIDEVQNIVSETGKFYKVIKNAIDHAPNDLRIILLSGTPIFDKPIEIALTMNLLKLPTSLPIKEFNETFLITQKNKKKELEYEAINMDIFKDMIKGYISFYRGAPPVSYPKKNLIIVRCRMSDYQYKSYKTVASEEGPFRTGDILKLPNNFFIGTRMLSNIAFPKKGINATGYRYFTGDKLQLQNLKEYSIKFYKILKNIKLSIGPVFVYSNFKEYGGLKSFIKVLKYHGYKNYRDYGEGNKRYAVWSGDESLKVKQEIKLAFNQKSNKNGENIKIMLGSPAIKEGISLLRVEQVHVMEPYWNLSRLEQVLGRAVRYCSHKDMPASRRHVDIFIYIAVHPKDKMTVDKYILQMAYKKEKIISKFEKTLKESAVDCHINYYGNTDRKNKLTCQF